MEKKIMFKTTVLEINLCIYSVNYYESGSFQKEWDCGVTEM